MKKQILITLLATALLGMASAAQAGDRHRGHYNGHNNHHGYARHHYGSFHYGRSHHYRPYRYYGYRQGHHDRYDGLQIAAGALVLGSIIYAAGSDRRHNTVYRTRPVASSRNDYRVDSEGQCFEVSLNRQGQEVWTYVDSSYCY